MNEPTTPASTPGDPIDSANVELTEDEANKISGGGIPGESMGDGGKLHDHGLED